MSDSIKLAQLPEDALAAIIASPNALDNEVLSAVANEVERRVAYWGERGTFIRKLMSARQHNNVLSLVSGRP